MSPAEQSLGPSAALPAVRQRIRRDEAQLIEDLKAFLSIPSISAHPDRVGDCRIAAEFVATQLRSAGCTTEIVDTPGHPIVLGRSPEVPGAPTVLVYGHYDVQPADPLDLWTSPPFEPTIRGEHLYARGATDDKGQMLTHVKSAAAWSQIAGRPPVNLIFVIEGEEEVGSRNLDDFLAARRKELRCDVAVISDSSQYAPEIPAINYGLRGIIACEIRVTGPAKDLHSGVFGGAVLNPVTALAGIIARLHDAEGRVQIPGFYDSVRPLTPEERAQFAALPFDEAAFRREVGVSEVSGEAGFTTLERRWARPTCEVNGFFGGYQGPGPKTIVPSKATAKITCRLVPDQDPERMTAALEHYVRSLCPPGIQLEFQSYHGCAAFVLDHTSPYIAAAGRAIESAFGRRPVLIREGGSIPVVSSFRQILGVDTLLLGWGQNSDNLHSPDEHFRLLDFQRGILASAALWAELAEMT